MIFPNILRDALVNCDTEWSKSEIKYSRGIVVGIVSVLMAQGQSFDQAFETVKAHLPNSYNPDVIPENWRQQ